MRWWMRWTSAQVNPGCLDLRIGIQHGVAHFSSVAALLVATERGSRVELVIGVDPDDTGFDQGDHFVRLLDVARPDTGCQPVDRPVIARGYCLHIFERHSNHHRAEDLFAGDGHVVTHLVENGGLHEVSLRQVTGGTFTPCRRRRPLAPPDLDRKSTRLNSSHTVISYAVFC